MPLHSATAVPVVSLYKNFADKRYPNNAAMVRGSFPFHVRLGFFRV